MYFRCTWLFRGTRGDCNCLLTYLLTYLLTPWCRVLLEQLTGLQLVKKFPAFHGTRRFMTALTSVRHLSLTWASPIQSIYPHYYYYYYYYYYYSETTPRFIHLYISYSLSTDSHFPMTSQLKDKNPSITPQRTEEGISESLK